MYFLILSLFLACQYRCIVDAVATSSSSSTSAALKTAAWREAAMEIKEPACLSLLDKIETIPIKVSPSVSIDTTYAKYTASPSSSQKKSTSSKASKASSASISNPFAKFFPSSSFSSSSPSSSPAVVMLHGFDSSCVEFRRLAPLLCEQGGLDVYVPDILGWGFSPNQLSQVPEGDFSPAAKMEHLACFVRQACGGRPVVVVGASLGGALAITLAVEYPELVSKLILIDAQGFIDGEGKKEIPLFLARFGVNVLKSQPLRMFANYIAYKDKKFATLDAMRIGRLHCLIDSWQDASVSFLLSGGFVVSDKVAKVEQKTLVLWGRQDEILEPSTADKFQKTLKNAEVVWVDECGHVPHLEQPSFCVEQITSFISK